MLLAVDAYVASQDAETSEDTVAEEVEVYTHEALNDVDELSVALATPSSVAAATLLAVPEMVAEASKVTLDDAITEPPLKRLAEADEQ